MLQKITAYFSNRSKIFITVISILLVILFGFIDYIAGYEVSFSIFYLFPVALVAWFVGEKQAFAISLLSAIVWVFANLKAGHIYSHPFITYWNTFVRFIFFLINAYLVSKIKERLELEKQLSREDALTGAANIRSFYEHTHQEIIRSMRYSRPLTIAYIDLDNFKAVNDQQGHNAGDELLKMVAQTIKKNIRSIDMVARLGGDEFALLLPENGSEESKIAIERLLDCLRKTVKNIELSITFSIGVITITGNTPSVKEVIKRADDLMYEAKRNGKNRIKYGVW